MQRFFDIHSHILPGVDDGAKNMEETRRMLLAAYEEGIRIITATPHFVAGKKSIPVENLKKILERVNQVAAGISEELQVILGNELFYSLQMLDALKKGDALTIDGTRYILVEFFQEVSFRELWEGLNNCIFEGYIPILAHAERYRCLLKKSELVEKLISLGVYIQINMSSIVGHLWKPRRRFCHKLLHREWVHFLGSDAHDLEHRRPRAKKAAAIIEKKYGVQMKRLLLWENPLKMVEDSNL